MFAQPKDSTIEKCVDEDGRVEWRLWKGVESKKGDRYLRSFWMLGTFIFVTWIVGRYDPSGLMIGPIQMLFFLLFFRVRSLDKGDAKRLVLNGSKLTVFRGYPREKVEKSFDLAVMSPRFVIRQLGCRKKFDFFSAYSNSQRATIEYGLDRVGVGDGLSERDLAWLARDVTEELEKVKGRELKLVCGGEERFVLPFGWQRLWVYRGVMYFCRFILIGLVGLMLYFLFEDHFVRSHSSNVVPIWARVVKESGRALFVGILLFSLCARVFLMRGEMSPYREVVLGEGAVILTRGDGVEAVKISLEEVMWIHGEASRLVIATGEKLWTLDYPLWNGKKMEGRLRNAVGLY